MLVKNPNPHKHISAFQYPCTYVDVRVYAYTNTYREWELLNPWGMTPQNNAQLIQNLRIGPDISLDNFCSLARALQIDNKYSFPFNPCYFTVAKSYYFMNTDFGHHENTIVEKSLTTTFSLFQLNLKQIDVYDIHIDIINQSFNLSMTTRNHHKNPQEVFPSTILQMEQNIKYCLISSIKLLDGHYRGH